MIISYGKYCNFCLKHCSEAIEMSGGKAPRTPKSGGELHGQASCRAGP